MILKLNKGDKVKLTKAGLSFLGSPGAENKVFVISEIIQDESCATDHIIEFGTENVNTCSCCNFARIEGSDIDFYIEEGDSELEKIEELS